jgi:hypothetical protein
LSPELFLNILRLLSSAKDLYAAIGVSSRFYRLFASYQHSINASILLRAIPAEIEADFVLAYRAQDIWQYVPEGSDDPFSSAPELDIDGLRKKTAAIFEETTIKSPSNLHILISNHKTLPKIWTFYSRFEYFIVKYATSALQELSPSFNIPALSISEEIRLKRAFFRCEIYICLFQVSQMTIITPIFQFHQQVRHQHISRRYALGKSSKSIVSCRFTRDSSNKYVTRWRTSWFHL